MSVNCCGLGGKRRRNAKISLMAAVRPEVAKRRVIEWPGRWLPKAPPALGDWRMARFSVSASSARPLTHSFVLLHGWRCHPHERGSEEFAGGAELPVEFGKAGASAGMASVG